MAHNRKVLIFTWVLCLQSFSGIAEASGRSKRELRFPKGSSLVAAVSAVSLFPKGPTDGLAHFVEFDLGFPFPDSIAIEKKEAQKRISGNPLKDIKTKNWYKNKPYKRYRGKRSLIETERENLILKIDDALTRMGFNGSSCTSRLQCELLLTSPENSLLEELLFALFKPTPEPEECKKHSSNCPISLLQILMHSKQIPTDVS